MDTDQKKFLQARFRKAVGDQPELKHLKVLLLRLGGDFIVAPQRADPDISALLEFGFLMRGPITMELMARNGCHQNVASLWKSPKRRIIGVATGYAMSEDGLWRQHSWGVLRDGLLETTEAREIYFGILLQGSGADRFCQTYLPSSVSRGSP
jgi:hypothetical protein